MPGARISSRARRRRLLAATLTAALVPAAVAHGAITTEPNRSRVSFDSGPGTVELVRNGITVGRAPGVTDSVNVAGQCWAGFTPQIQPGDTVRLAGGPGMTVQGPLSVAVPTGDPLTGNWSAAGNASGPGPFTVSLPDVAGASVPVSSGPFTAPFTIATGTTPAQSQLDAGSGDITRVRSDDPATPGPADGCPPFNTDAVTAVDAGHLIAGAPIINAANVGQAMTVAGPTATEGVVSATLGNATTTTPGSAGTWSALFTPSQLSAMPEGQLTAGIGASGATLTVLKDTVAPSQPTSSPPPGRYLNAPTVSLAAEPGSRVHFTVDGSTPTGASPVYTAPIRVGSSSTIRAFAIDAVGNAGPVAALTYQLGPDAGSPGGTVGGSANNQGGVKPGTTTKPSAARITLVKISKRVSLRRLRKQGLGVGVQLSSGTGAVRFMVYRRATRKGKTSYRLAASVVRAPTAPRYRARLNARSLGLVRTGVYRLRIVPGITRTTLDSDAARTIFLRVVR